MNDLLFFDDVLEDVTESESEYVDSASGNDNSFVEDSVSDDSLVREESDIFVSDNESYDLVFSGVSSESVSNNQVVSVNYVPVPVSGDSVTYNYYVVSDNSLSYNLMNKPINEYSVSEGLSLVHFLLFCSVGLVLLIRRCIYQWK